MPIAIQPYREEHEPAVQEFNLRLRDGGADPTLVFYRYYAPRWLPRVEDCHVYNEYFVAIEDGVVRGGYALKHQNFFFPDGSVRSIGCYHHSLSEGIVNKSCAIVGTLLVRDAMQRSPLLYCLGMGGYDNPLPKMLLRLGWSHRLLPFYFRVVHARRFLKEIKTLRQSPWRRRLMDFGASTGMGWLAVKLLHSVAELKSARTALYEVEEVEEFSVWADAVWERAKEAFALTAVRDSETLRQLYPVDDKHFSRLRVRRNGTDIGWAVVGERRTDVELGTLRVGSLVDCWSSPEDFLPVVRAATRRLEQQGMDLIVSNQSHLGWCQALKAAGFFSGPSNFIFAVSRELARLLEPFEKTQSRMHVTRADGDGLPRNF